MNANHLVLTIATLSVLVIPLRAGPRTSANYTIITDSANAGGKWSGSAAYTNDGTMGDVAGVSTVAAPSETAKSGYIGQLYEVTGLTLTSASPNVNESATVQLGAWQALDDASFLAVPANSITWSIVSGPLSNISVGGLATATTVYQNTAATAEGAYAGNTGTLGLTVLNSILDNYGAYSGDGIGDDWQVQYFGLSNPNAAPLLDPDGDGHNNRFEFTAGIDPTNPLSVFNWRIDSVPGFPNQKKLMFSPRFGTRTYTVKTSLTLGTGATWSTLTSGTTSDNGSERTVTDTSATSGAKFYSVEIVKP